MVNNSPSPNLSIIIFNILTLIYFYVKYKHKTSSITIFIVYILALISGQLIINIYLTNTLCGTPQLGTAIFFTLLPWFAIFGGLNIALRMFPSWLIAIFKYIWIWNC